MHPGRLPLPRTRPAIARLLETLAFWSSLLLGFWWVFFYHRTGQNSVALLALCTYGIGACGIKSHSAFASALMLSWTLLGMVGNVVMHLLVPWKAIPLSIILAGALWARWTLRAEKCTEDSTPQPSRTFVARSARSAWRILRIPYLLLGSLLVLASLYGTVDAVTKQSPTITLEK